MAFSFAPQLAFLAGPLGAISAGRQYLRQESVFPTRLAAVKRSRSSEALMK